MIPVIQKKFIIYPEGLNGMMAFTTCGLNFGHFTAISSFLSIKVCKTIFMLNFFFLQLEGKACQVLGLIA